MTLSAAAGTALESARQAEREQTVRYRALAAQAEARGDLALAERINGLLADEQHHYSRLSARLMEFGHTPLERERAGLPSVALDGWETDARERERDEVARYEAMLELELDERTRAVIVEILESERRHLAELGGKWMGA